jgi:hypothetical protein
MLKELHTIRILQNKVRRVDLVNERADIRDPAKKGLIEEMPPCEILNFRDVQVLARDIKRRVQ